MKVPAFDLDRLSRLTPQQIRSEVRRQWQSSGMKHAAIQRQAVSHLYIDGEGQGKQRRATFIRCAHCNELFGRDMVQINHRVAVGSLNGTSPADIKDFINRVYRPLAELEAVCKPCHRKHTNETRKLLH